MSAIRISSFGVVSPVGSKEEIWNSILNNISIGNDVLHQVKGMRKCSTEISLEHNNVDPRFSRRTDKQIIYQLMAGCGAVAGINNLSKINKERIGIFTGSLFAQLEFGMEQIRALITSGDKNDISMYTGVSFYYGAASGEMSILLKSKGENAAICDGACSGIDCVISGSSSIKRNINDVVLAIGGENLNEPVIAEMIPKPVKEDSVVNPDEYFYASGAVCVLLTNNKMSDIEIEVISALNINDCESLFICGKNFKNHFKNGVIKCLSDVNVSVTDIDLVIPGFNNTGKFDVVELEALNELFQYNGKILYTPIPYTGDMLSASGNIKIYVASMCIKQGMIPANDRDFFNEDFYIKYQHLFFTEKTVKPVNTVLIIQRDVVGGRMSFLLIRKSGKNENL